VKAASPLPDSALIVLAILAEGENHGYGIERLVHNRGFRFWTNLRRSSVYKTLSSLQTRGLITAHDGVGGGPTRNVYRISRAGMHSLRREGLGKLADPGHPRSDIDVALYLLPFLPRAEAMAALDACLSRLRDREAFIAERLAWCQERGLDMPALNFERPLLALRAELTWLDQFAKRYASGAETRPTDWSSYVTPDPLVDRGQ